MTDINRSLWSAFGLFVFMGLTYIVYTGYVIPELMVMGRLTPEATQLSHSRFMWPIIGYILVSGNACMAVSIFKPLKPWNNERSLLFALSACFFWGLVLGIIPGFIWGNLVTNVYSGLHLGLVTGLLLGLMTGLFVGLSVELRRR